VKQTLTSISLLSLLIFFGCSGSYYTEIDTHKKTRIRTLPEFNTLNLSGNFEVTVNANNSQKIEIIANDDVLPFITTEVKNKQLNISTSKDLGKTTFIGLKISMKYLKEINSSGITEIVVNNINSKKLTINISGTSDLVTNGTTNKFVVNVSGAADLTANGNTDKFIINISGASEVHAKNLQSKIVDVNISGAGDILVNAVDKLNVDISGAGDINYTGNPQEITKDISGFGTVSKQE
jgi:hypothetical protein